MNTAARGAPPPRAPPARRGLPFARELRLRRQRARCSRASRSRPASTPCAGCAPARAVGELPAAASRRWPACRCSPRSGAPVRRLREPRRARPRDRLRAERSLDAGGASARPRAAGSPPAPPASAAAAARGPSTSAHSPVVCAPLRRAHGRSACDRRRRAACDRCAASRDVAHRRWSAVVGTAPTQFASPPGRSGRSAATAHPQPSSESAESRYLSHTVAEDPPRLARRLLYPGVVSKAILGARAGYPSPRTLCEEPARALRFCAGTGLSASRRDRRARPAREHLARDAGEVDRAGRADEVVRRRRLARRAKREVRVRDDAHVESRRERAGASARAARDRATSSRPRASA